MAFKVVEQTVKRQDGEQVLRLAVSDLATIYGCCGLLDMCGDGDLLSLSLAGTEPFLDVLSWQRSDVCKIHKDFITYVRSARSNGAATAGWLSDPCADANGIDYGGCNFEIEDFGRLRRVSPTRDITKADLRYCENQPRYRLDGTPINDDMEYGLRLATEVLLQDLKRLVITGNHSTAGQFDGLEQLVVTGYTSSDGHRCRIMDSIVIDWHSNGLAGGAGMTWNGAAIAATHNFVDVLLATFRRIRDRIAMAPALSAPLAPGDVVFVAPTALIRCLLDLYTCWSVCPSAFLEGDVLTGLNSLEGRRFRDSLNGGMFGAGRIWLDGFEIPMLPYNWGLIQGPTRFDAYLLTLKVGGVRLLNGEYNNMNRVLRLPGIPNTSIVNATDGGRFLTWPNSENTCVQFNVEMQPRILCWAPWAQVRFQDVACNQPGGPISPDPEESSFFPESSFITSECPEDEVPRS